MGWQCQPLSLKLFVCDYESHLDATCNHINGTKKQANVTISRMLIIQIGNFNTECDCQSHMFWRKKLIENDISVQKFTSAKIKNLLSEKIRPIQAVFIFRC